MTTANLHSVPNEHRFNDLVMPPNQFASIRVDRWGGGRPQTGAFEVAMVMRAVDLVSVVAHLASSVLVIRSTYDTVEVDFSQHTDATGQMKRWFETISRIISQYDPNSVVPGADVSEERIA